ncbi:MAG: hypothetical protein PHU12_01115, partial [Candidatus Aenigmarchaeota archaeon]|nr:hypothetical protein [Candidatus Aenigmarchaeota archaeon]
GTVGTTGGSNTHSHSTTITTGTYTTGVTNAVTGAGAYATVAHTHSGTGTSNITNQQPPYITIILAKADTDRTLPTGMIGMFNATPGSTLWEIVSSSGKPFYEKFIVGSAAYGTTSGLSTHTHATLTISTGVPSATATNGMTSGSSQDLVGSSTHTHNIGVTFSTDNNLPPYNSVILGYALGHIPQWSNNKTSLASGVQYSSSNNYGFDITWTDNQNDVDKVLFETNLTGTLQNFSSATSPAVTNSTYQLFYINFTNTNITGAGTYVFKWYANDTSNNINNSDQWYYTIARNTTNTLNLYLNGTQANRTYTYPESVNATATAQQGTVNLYRNSSLVISGTSPQSENIRLYNGTHQYFVNATGNTNYSDNTTGIGYYAIVNQGIANVTLSLLPATPIYYGTQTTATCNANAYETSPNLYRNNTNANSENNTATTLPAGTWTYVCNISSTQNYTGSTTTESYIVNKAGTNITLYLNGTAWTNDWSITYPNATNINATANVSGIQSSVLLYRNESAQSNPDQIMLGASSYNYTGYFDGNENYTTSNTTRYLTINQNTSTATLMNITFNGTEGNNSTTYPAGTNVTGYFSSIISGQTITFTLYKNSSVLGITNPITEINQSAAGYYIYTYSTAGNANFSAASKSYNLTINKANNPINLYLNGTQANKIYTYPESINATATSTGGTISLTRNGTSYATCIATRCYEYVSLGNGTYEFNTTATGDENYTDNSTTVSYYAYIAKGSTTTYLYLNGSRANTGYATNDPANFTASVNLSGATVYIAANITGFTTVSGITPLYNYTTLIDSGVYNITGYYPESENYSASSESWYATVSGTAALTAKIDSMSPTSMNKLDKSTLAGNCTCTGATCSNTYVEIQADASPIPTGTSGNLQVNGSSSYSLGNSFLASNYTGWNITGLRKGTYQIRVMCNSTETSSVYSVAQTLTVLDNTSANWSANQSIIAVNYSLTNYSQFNISWSDDEDIHTVFIESNWTGTNTNYTMSNATYGGAIYNYTLILPAGTYYWKSYVNDTSNNWNTSDTWYFTVGKSVNLAYLYLNATQSNTIYTYPQSINATSTVTAGTALLWRNGTSVGATEENIRLGNGTYEYKSNTSGTANYSVNDTGVTYYAYVAKGTTTIYLAINGTQGNVNLEYNDPAMINATGWKTVDDETLTLYRNDTIMIVSTSGNVITNITSEDPTGVYNYSLNMSSYNYTASSVEWNVTLGDTGYPTVTIILPENITYNYSTSIDVNFSAYDSGGLNWCGYSLDGAANQTLFACLNETHDFTDGNHRITIFVNDTSGNSNKSETINFTVDTTSPLTTLNLPANNTNVTRQNVLFNFTTTDELSNATNCSIKINDVINLTNSTVYNNTLTNFYIIGMPEGLYYWNITCKDSVNNSNTSETNVLRVDLTGPLVVSYVQTPNISADLDPGITVNITHVSITDLSSIDTVILQYKTDGTVVWNNQTMTLNQTSGYYNGSFSAPIPAGYWNYRIWANDTSGNANYSDTANISVDYEKSWTITPTTLGSVTGTLSQTKSVGEILINNTGDYELSFTLSNDAPYGMTYNETVPFNLAAGQVKYINISATFGTTSRSDNATITITTPTPDTTPASDTVSVTLVTYAGGDYLTAGIDKYNLTVNQSGILDLGAYVKNIGNETANQTWVLWTLATGMSNTSGLLNESLGNLTSSLTNTSNLTLSVGTNTTAGLNTITIYAASAGLTTATDSLVLQVYCNSSDSVCGSGCTYLTDSNCEQEVVTETVTTPSGSTGGLGGGGVSGTTKVSQDTWEMLRGESKTFELPVKNIYADSELKNLHLNISGFLSKYVKVTPATLDGIKYGETQKFYVTIDAPAYLDIQKYLMTFEIQGTLSKQNGTVDISYDDKRYLTLFVRLVSKEQAQDALLKVQQAIDELAKENIPYDKINQTLTEALKYFDDQNYESVKELTDKIISSTNAAIETNKIISQIEQYIKDAELMGLPLTETKNLLALSKTAFDRGDYQLALTRIQDALAAYALESGGKVNVLKFLIDYWWLALISGALILVGLILFAKQATLFLIRRRLRNISIEEESAFNMIRDTQMKFVKKKLTYKRYRDKIDKFEKRLADLRAERSSLETKRRGVIKASKELQILHEENVQINKLIRNLQDQYYNKRTIGSEAYHKRMEEYRIKKTDAEEQLALVEAKLTGNVMLKDIFKIRKEKIKKKNSKQVKRRRK